MITLPTPRAVIFDWDDTIINSWGPTLKALNKALTEMGEKPWTDEEARAKAGASAKDLFKQLFGERWQEADKIFFDYLRALFREHLPIYPDVEPILKLLKEREVYMAVVSNKRGPLLREEAKEAGFDKYFGRVIGAGDAEKDKPDSAPVRMALEGSGIAPGEHVWFIGDSHADMRCAANAGCTALLVETKPPPEETLVNHPPRKRFKNHADIMEFLKVYFT